MNSPTDLAPDLEPVEQRLRQAYAQRAAEVPHDLPIPHAVEVRLSALASEGNDVATSRFVPLRLEPANFKNGPRRKQRGRVVGLAAVAAAVTLVALLQTGRFQQSTKDRWVRAAAQPGYILTTVPAGLGRGTRIYLVDPQNLAAEPPSFTMQYRQRNGKGRLSIQPDAVSIGGPWVSGPYVEVGGKRLTIIVTGRKMLVSVPVGKRFARIDSSNTDRVTLNAFASAVGADGPVFSVSPSDVPNGWEGRRAPNRPYDEYMLRSTEYRNDQNAIFVSALSSTSDKWSIQRDRRPYQRQVTASGVVYDVNGSGQFWSAVSESQRVAVSGVGPATSNIEALLTSLRQATSDEWAKLGRTNAYAIGSTMVTGTIVDEGTIAGVLYRTIRRPVLPSSNPYAVKPLFTTGLIGVSGASVSIYPGDSADVPIGWAPGGAIVKVPTAQQPRTATLTLTGKSAVTATFLPAVEGQTFQVAFFPGVTSPTTGTYSVTSNDPKNPTVERDVTTGLTVT